MKYITLLLVVALSVSVLAAVRNDSKHAQKSVKPAATVKQAGREKPMTQNEGKDIKKSDEQWKKELSPEQYRVLREKGTEAPFSGKYWDTETKGIYKCAACGNVLFESKTKFEAGCGWPSFYSPKDAAGVNYHEDSTHGMRRTEVTCAKCGAHLGHVFDDGPKPTGKRFCINSVSLELVPDEKK